MPKNYKTGTPKKKTKQCWFCDARPRSKKFKRHLVEVHNFEDYDKSYSVKTAQDWHWHRAIMARRAEVTEETRERLSPE